MAGSAESWDYSRSTKRAAWRVLGVYLGYLGTLTGIAVAMGAMPFTALLMVPVTGLGMPLSPQARGDYFLAKPASL